MAGPLSHRISHPSPNVFEIELPGGLKVHNRMNVKNLRPANHVECNKPPPVHVHRNGVEYEVQDLTGHSMRDGQTFIRVKWVGDDWAQTWEPLASVRHLHILLKRCFKGRPVPTV